MSCQTDNATAARSRSLLLVLSLALILIVAFACSGQREETPSTETPASQETPSDDVGIDETPAAQETPSGDDGIDETPAAQETPDATVAPTAEVTPGEGVTGVWTGIFGTSEADEGGVFCLALEQSGNQLFGALYLIDELAGSLTGELDGGEITFSLLNGATYSGIMDGDKLSGTWEEPGGADAGSWRVSRSGLDDCL